MIHLIYNLKGIVFQIQFAAEKIASLHFIAKIYPRSTQLWVIPFH